MTTIHSRFLLVLAAASGLGGCARSFEALGSRDGGATPAMEDAGPVGDGGSPACTGALELVDRTPFHVPGRAVTVASSGDRFWLAYFHSDPTPCDGACWGVRELDARSAPEDFQPAYWMEEGLGTLDAAMEARTAIGSALLVARSGGGTTRWQTRPLRVEGWMAEGSWSLPLDTELADVAPGPSGSVLVATYAPDADGDDLHEALAVERRSVDGATVLASEAVPALFGADRGVRDVRITPGATGSRPWIAAVQTRGDSPPTVQVARLGDEGETSIHASSCGVRSFHAADGIDQLAVVQDCDGSTVLELRGAPEASAVIDARRASVPSRVAVSNTLVVVAHLEPDAITPSVTVVRRIEPGLVSVEETIRLPGETELVDPAGALDIAVLSDGTIAVAWSTVSPDPSPEAGEIAVVRLRPCVP